MFDKDFHQEESIEKSLSDYSFSPKRVRATLALLPTLATVVAGAASAVDINNSEAEDSQEQIPVTTTIDSEELSELCDLSDLNFDTDVHESRFEACSGKFEISDSKLKELQSNLDAALARADSAESDLSDSNKSLDELQQHLEDFAQLTAKAQNDIDKAQIPNDPGGALDNLDDKLSHLWSNSIPEGAKFFATVLAGYVAGVIANGKRGLIQRWRDANRRYHNTLSVSYTTLEDGELSFKDQEFIDEPVLTSRTGVRQSMEIFFPSDSKVVKQIQAAADKTPPGFPFIIVEEQAQALRWLHGELNTKMGGSIARATAGGPHYHVRFRLALTSEKTADLSRRDHIRKQWKQGEYVEAIKACNPLSSIPGKHWEYTRLVQVPEATLAYLADNKADIFRIKGNSKSLETRRQTLGLMANIYDYINKQGLEDSMRLGDAVELQEDILEREEKLELSPNKSLPTKYSDKNGEEQSLKELSELSGSEISELIETFSGLDEWELHKLRETFDKAGSDETNAVRTIFKEMNSSDREDLIHNLGRILSHHDLVIASGVTAFNQRVYDDVIKITAPEIAFNSRERAAAAYILVRQNARDVFTSLTLLRLEGRISEQQFESVSNLVISHHQESMPESKLLRDQIWEDYKKKNGTSHSAA